MLSQLNFFLLCKKVLQQVQPSELFNYPCIATFSCYYLTFLMENLTPLLSRALEAEHEQETLANLTFSISCSALING